jgi:hypothetical protein
MFDLPGVIQCVSRTAPEQNLVRGHQYAADFGGATTPALVAPNIRPDHDPRPGGGGVGPADQRPKVDSIDGRESFEKRKAQSDTKFRQNDHEKTVFSTGG